MENLFSASTREVVKTLGLGSEKTLFRRRVDYHDEKRGVTTRFLLPNVHFRRKTPASTALVWNLEMTVRAWETALTLATEKPAR